MGADLRRHKAFAGCPHDVHRLFRPVRKLVLLQEGSHRQDRTNSRDPLEARTGAGLKEDSLQVAEILQIRKELPVPGGAFPVKQGCMIRPTKPEGRLTARPPPSFR